MTMLQVTLGNFMTGCVWSSKYMRYGAKAVARQKIVCWEANHCIVSVSVNIYTEFCRVSSVMFIYNVPGVVDG